MVRPLIVTAALVVILAAVKIAASLVVPFLLAVFLAILVSPPSLRLQRIGLPVSIAMTVMIVALGVLCVLTVTILRTSLDQFVQSLPQYQEQLTLQLNSFADWLKVRGMDKPETFIADIFNPQFVMSYAGAIARALSGMLGQAVIIFIVTAFMLAEAGSFDRKFRAITGADENGLEALAENIQAVRHYVSLKSVMSLLTGLLVSLWLWVLGVDNAIFMGLLAFFLNFVPTIGSIVAAVVGAYQVFGPPALQRATGTIHPILFGDLSLLMGLLSFAGLMWFIQHRQWLIVIPLLAVITGLIASALSLSRGGWVAIPVAVLIYVWFYAQYFSRKTLITVFLLLMSTLATIYLVPETGVQKRVEKTFTNINRYYHSENTNDPARHSSIGARFEMWRSAWNMFLENPVLGGGWGEFQNYNQKYIKEGKVNKVAGKFYHAHNQYISILAKGGVISFISLLFLFFVPALLFYRIIKGSSQTDVKSYALAGLIIIAAYAGFALSEAILERSRPVIFFSFYLAVFMAATRKRNLNPEATN